jgi:hypothetical protein
MDTTKADWNQLEQRAAVLRASGVGEEVLEIVARRYIEQKRAAPQHQSLGGILSGGQSLYEKYGCGYSDDASGMKYSRTGEYTRGRRLGPRD